MLSVLQWIYCVVELSVESKEMIQEEIIQLKGET